MANNVLELRGKRFVQAARNITGGGASMNSKKVLSINIPVVILYFSV